MTKTCINYNLETSFISSLFYAIRLKSKHFFPDICLSQFDVYVEKVLEVPLESQGCMEHTTAVLIFLLADHGCHSFLLSPTKQETFFLKREVNTCSCKTDPGDFITES
jgi:hypothetical protein